jgi:hypothetical protein
MLEHLLRFFCAFFSPVLLENVNECLVGGQGFLVYPYNRYYRRSLQNRSCKASSG